MVLPFLPIVEGYVINQPNSPFQSLFLWIFRSYRVTLRVWKMRFLVSILVLMDLPFLLVNTVYWIFAMKRFNPCSYGSSVLTLRRGAVLLLHWIEFQSLFLWIFRSYLKINKTRGGSGSVSILVLMDLPFLHWYVHEGPQRAAVSILVLMDLPFLHP